MWTFVQWTAAAAVECIKWVEQVGLTIPRFPASFHENGSIDFHKDFKNNSFSLRPLQHYSLLLKAIAGSPQGPRGSPVLPIPTWQTALLHYSLLTNTYIAAKYQVFWKWILYVLTFICADSFSLKYFNNVEYTGWFFLTGPPQFQYQKENR